MGRPKGSANGSSKDNAINAEVNKTDADSQETQVENLSDIITPIASSNGESAPESEAEDDISQEHSDKNEISIPEKKKLLELAPDIYNLLNSGDPISNEEIPLVFEEIAASLDSFRFQKAMSGWGLLHEDFPWVEPDAVRHMPPHPSKKEIWHIATVKAALAPKAPDFISVPDTPFMTRPQWLVKYSPIKGDKPNSFNLKMRVAQQTFEDRSCWNSVLQIFGFSRIESSSAIFIKLGIKYDSSLFDGKKYKISPVPNLVYGYRINGTDLYNPCFQIANNDIYDMDGEAGILVLPMGADSESTRGRFRLKEGMEIAYIQFDK